MKIAFIEANKTIFFGRCESGFKLAKLLFVMPATNETRSLLKKFPKTEFFLVGIFLHSGQTQKNTDRKKLRIWTLFEQWLKLFSETPQLGIGWTIISYSIHFAKKPTLREKCPYLDLFWSVFSHIRRKIRTRISPNTGTFYAVQPAQYGWNGWGFQSLVARKTTVSGSLFLIKFYTGGFKKSPVGLKRDSEQAFSSEFCEIFTNIYFEDHLRTAASKMWVIRQDYKLLEDFREREYSIFQIK